MRIPIPSRSSSEPQRRPRAQLKNIPEKPTHKKKISHQHTSIRPPLTLLLSAMPRMKIKLQFPLLPSSEPNSQLLISPLPVTRPLLQHRPDTARGTHRVHCPPLRNRDFHPRLHSYRRPAPPHT